MQRFIHSKDVRARLKLAVMAGCLAAAPAASGQSNPFYDKPSESAQAEVESWGTMFVALSQSGTPSASAGMFAFTDVKMNSPLFAPDIAAIRVISFAKYGVNSAANCNAVEGVTQDEKTLQLTKSEVKAETSTPTYFVALLATAVNDPNASIVIDGSTLIAQGLTVPPDEGVLAEKTFANAAPETMAWIASLNSFSEQTATGMDHSDDAKRRLTGEPRSVDLLENEIKAWATRNNVSMGTYQVEALFGAYGALPLIVCSYGWGDGSAGPEHGFVLVDGVNGKVDGPYETHSAINPSTLLSYHSDDYLAGSGVTIVRAGTLDCTPVADTRTPYPVTTPPTPPWTVPPGLVPIPTPPGGTRPPGAPQPWKCTTSPTATRPDPTQPVSPSNPTIPAGVCTCKSNWIYVPGGTTPAPCPPGHTFPTLCDIKYEVVCFDPTAAACNGGPSVVPAPAPPATPPISVPGTGNPPMSPTNPTTTCVEFWWYWS